MLTLMILKNLKN